MVRILNFFCVALMGVSILALYHVSEKTRVAHMQLSQVNTQIAQEKAHIGVLETEWQHVASPERIHKPELGICLPVPTGVHGFAAVADPDLDILPECGAQ